MTEAFAFLMGLVLGWWFGPLLDRLRAPLASSGAPPTDLSQLPTPRPASPSRSAPGVPQNLPEAIAQYDEATIEAGTDFMVQQARAAGVPLSLRDARAEAIRMLSESQ